MQELARTIEEIDGREAIPEPRILRGRPAGRGGDHYPFYVAGYPAVRFTEPLEDYHHEHQTPRVENGVEYGDLIKYLDFKFLGNVARDNAEALRELALAPAAPTGTELSGAVTPMRIFDFYYDSERAGFEILWRETTDSRWQAVQLRRHRRRNRAEGRFHRQPLLRRACRGKQWSAIDCRAYHPVESDAGVAGSLQIAESREMFTVVACRGNLFSDKYRVSTPHGRERRLILQISNKHQHFKVVWADSLCVVGKPEVIQNGVLEAFRFSKGNGTLENKQCRIGQQHRDSGQESRLIDCPHTKRGPTPLPRWSGLRIALPY